MLRALHYDWELLAAKQFLSIVPFGGGQNSKISLWKNGLFAKLGKVDFDWKIPYYSNGRTPQKSANKCSKMYLKTMMRSIATCWPQKCANWVPGSPLGCFWGAFAAPLRHPWERNYGAFFRSASKEGPKVDFGCIFGAFGGDVGRILEAFWAYSGSYLRTCSVVFVM